MYARDFRALARQALAEKWTLAVLTGLVAALLGGTIGSGDAASTFSTQANDIVQDYGWYLDIPDFVYTILFILASLYTIYVIVCLIFGGAVRLGYAKFNLALVDHKQADFQDIFSQFDRFGSGFLLNLLTFVFVLLWTLLLIIPGIIAGFSYSMAPYILYENPGMRPYDALRASKDLMKGNKWRLFCLEFSFIGWAILCAFTLGIGYLWLRPYEEAASASFYRQICYERSGGQSASYRPAPDAFTHDYDDPPEP